MKVTLLVAILVAMTYAALCWPYLGSWQTDPQYNDRVMIVLRVNGTFEGSESHLADSKPGPNYRMHGSWTLGAGEIRLFNIQTVGLFKPEFESIQLPIEGGHLIWHPEPNFEIRMSKVDLTVHEIGSHRK